MTPLERLARRADKLALAHARRRRERLAEQVAAGAPADVAVAIEGDAVVLSGRGLARRRVEEAEIRWLVAEALDE